MKKLKNLPFVVKGVKKITPKLKVLPTVRLGEIVYFFKYFERERMFNSIEKIWSLQPCKGVIVAQTSKKEYVVFDLTTFLKDNPKYGTTVFFDNSHGTLLHDKDLFETQEMAVEDFLNKIKQGDKSLLESKKDKSNNNLLEGVEIDG